VLARLRESARPRALGALGICFVLLLVGAGHAAAQDRASRLTLASADDPRPAASEPASPARPYPVYRLLPDDSVDREPWMASADLGAGSSLTLGLDPERSSGMPFRPAGALDRRLASAALTVDDAPPQVETPEREIPRWDFLERNRKLLSIVLPVATVALVSIDALLPYSQDPFRVDMEGWFGRNTDNGGADKASHLADYYIIAGLYEDIGRMMGFSDKEAVLWAFGVALATGLAVEVNNGFSKEYGFSPEDFAMDVAGATISSVLSLTRTRDLFGLRTSHLPSDTYTHDVYSADFKFSGLEKRLGIKLYPLRWLLFSFTYGAKGYQVSPPTTLQRQIGLEIGLNFQQILNDIGVRRSTWWGYGLHLVFDNVRFPFTAVGFRYDLNSGKWHGPNSGNYD
jgi:hypothetical protein